MNKSIIICKIAAMRKGVVKIIPIVYIHSVNVAFNLDPERSERKFEMCIFESLCTTRYDLVVQLVVQRVIPDCLHPERGPEAFSFPGGR